MTNPPSAMTSVEFMHSLFGYVVHTVKSFWMNVKTFKLHAPLVFYW